MAKVAKSDPSATALAIAAATPLVPQGDYGEFGGAGFENTTSEDVSVPFLGILQGLSPEVNGASKIRGASSGMLINTVTKELFEGAEGVIFQPVDTKHVFVEWKPRTAGGGFVKMHDLDSPDVLKCKADQEFGKYKTDAGNDLIETYYLTGMIHREEDIAAQAIAPPEPMVIAFTSTKIKAYKSIMTRLRTVRGNPPLFAHRLRVTTVDDKNQKGEFSNYRLAPLVNDNVIASMIPAKLEGATNPLLVAGHELMKANRGADFKANYDKQGTGDAAGGTEEKPPF